MTDFERQVRRLFNFVRNDEGLLISWICEIHEQDYVDRKDAESDLKELAERLGWYL